MSKHGGSPESGLVSPIGLEALMPATPEGMVLVPQEVVDARAQAKKREERALQLERRRIALQLIPSQPTFATSPGQTLVDLALAQADELISATGGGI